MFEFALNIVHNIYEQLVEFDGALPQGQHAKAFSGFALAICVIALCQQL